MTDSIKMCFTCRKIESNKFYNVQSCDTDKISYLEKLKSCVTSELVENNDMEMCGICIKHLRISYKFRITVLMSQELFRKDKEGEELMKTEECEDIKEFINDNEHNAYIANHGDYMKSGSDSDNDFVGGDNYSSDDSACKDIIDTVNSLTKKLKQKRAKQKCQLEIKNDDTFTCEYCDFQCHKNWQLKKHLARVHNEVRKFVCSFCEKEFKQAYHLKEHITSHTGEKNYTCPICDKKFQRQSSQRRHIKGHDAPPGHKTKRTPFLCTICGKSFPFSNGVQRHMRIHLGIKNFECKLCNRKFTQSTHLQVHMRTHTGEKPYICDTCGEKFSLKSCMLKHINNRHYRAKNVTEELPIFYLPKEFEKS